jgi:putative acetyltransferase
LYLSKIPFYHKKGIKAVRLEAGVLHPEAIGLYERMGYSRIEPFGEYLSDP